MQKFFTLFTALFITLSADAQKNLTLISSTTFGSQTLAGCWHYNDNTGKEYAIVGAEDNLLIVDITNPVTPVLLQSIPAPSSLWREVKVLGDYAYSVTEAAGTQGVNAGLLVVDLTTLPGMVNYKFWDGDGPISGQLSTGHTITAANGYVYINGSNIGVGGVIIVDVTNPYFPTYAGEYTIAYCHDSYYVNDTLFTSEIYAGRFGAVDVSNKANPVVINQQTTPGNFNHNTWISDNHRVLFTADEVAGSPLGSYDISNINNIQLLDIYFADTLGGNEVHNVRVLNDFLLCPSYGSQVTIVDAAHPNNLIEVGNYITGNWLCWDADPYLPSGRMIATETSPGTLYIFEPNYVRACYLEGNVRDTATNLPINGVDVQILFTNKLTASDILGDYRTGVADSGLYTVTFTKAGYYPKTVTNVVMLNGITNLLNVKLVPIGFGITENEEHSILKVYPNPASDEINFEFNGNKQESCVLTLFDIVGKKIFEKNITSPNKGSFSISSEVTGKGIFTYRVKNELNKSAFGKFTVQ